MMHNEDLEVTASLTCITYFFQRSTMAKMHDIMGVGRREGVRLYLFIKHDKALTIACIIGEFRL